MAIVSTFLYPHPSPQTVFVEGLGSDHLVFMGGGREDFLKKKIVRTGFAGAENETWKD